VHERRAGTTATSARRTLAHGLAEGTAGTGIAEVVARWGQVRLGE
jgi:hypothetical protein